jgi:hypothetical protein
MDKFRKPTKKEMFFGIDKPLTDKEVFFGNESKDKIIEKLSYTLGETVGLLKGIEKTCHDKMLKYEIQQAIEKIEKINGSNTQV